MRIILSSHVRQRTKDGQVNINFLYTGGGTTTVIITAARKSMNDCGGVFFLYLF